METAGSNKWGGAHLPLLPPLSLPTLSITSGLSAELYRLLTFNSHLCVNNESPLFGRGPDLVFKL